MLPAMWVSHRNDFKPGLCVCRERLPFSRQVFHEVSSDVLFPCCSSPIYLGISAVPSPEGEKMWSWWQYLIQNFYHFCKWEGGIITPTINILGPY